jgi:hypothetical protein
MQSEVVIPTVGYLGRLEELFKEFIQRVAYQQQ